MTNNSSKAKKASSKSKTSNGSSSDTFGATLSIASTPSTSASSQWTEETSSASDKTTPHATLEEASEPSSSDKHSETPALKRTKRMTKPELTQVLQTRKTKSYTNSRAERHPAATSTRKQTSTRLVPNKRKTVKKDRTTTLNSISTPLPDSSESSTKELPPNFLKLLHQSMDNIDETIKQGVTPQIYSTLIARKMKLAAAQRMFLQQLYLKNSSDCTDG